MVQGRIELPTIMAPPRIELGTHPRQGYVLPLNYEALIKSKIKIYISLFSFTSFPKKFSTLEICFGLENPTFSKNSSTLSFP